MNARTAYLGIDFGTTNSSIAYVLPDPREADAMKVTVETVRVETDEARGTKADRIPTIVSASFDKRRGRALLVGWEFARQFWRPRRKASLLRHGQTFFRSVKSDLGSFRVYPHAFSPDCNTPEKVAAAVIGRLLDEARRQLQGYDVFAVPVVITVPASLGALGREQTLAAARLAGLKPELTELIDEPVAALLDFLNDGRAAGLLDGDEPKNLLVFDYGGGTLDLSLVRARFDMQNKTGLEVEHLAISEYRRLGGDDVDRAVMQEVVWPQIEEHLGHPRDKLSRDLRQMIEDTLTPTVARMLKEQICRKVSDIASEGKSRRPREVEAIEPVQRTFEEVRMPRHFRITSGQFEALMRPFLAVPSEDEDKSPRLSLLVPLIEVLHRGGLEPMDLDAIILHGGSCRNPYVRQLLVDVLANQESLFCNTRVLETPDLDASVARGAALSGYWRRERGLEIVATITAEAVGIVTLNDKPVELVESGQPLPFPDDSGVHLIETAFYVPQNGMREMLVPFYTGRWQGSKHPVAGSVKIHLPPQTKCGAVVRIKLRVERDKTLHWWFNVDGGAFTSAPHLQNPWTTAVLTLVQQRLQEHQRKMREVVEAGNPVSASMELQEAALLYEAGRYDEAELALIDFNRHYPGNGRAANLLGLLCDIRRDPDGALRWYKQAAELKPQDPVLLGNLGYTLADHGDTAGGEARMRQALAADPNLRYLYVRLGDLYRQRGDEQAARREYAEAIRIAERELGQWPESGRLWWTAANLYHKIGDYEKSAEARTKAAKLDQDERFGGDHALRIAGPDSGFLKAEDGLGGDDL
jgi:molecular chaperone DnaK (HSP70)/Flp pilus assembly protein TadD